MSYHRERWQGVGAIAAALPATRSAPAPTILTRMAPRPGTTTNVACTVVDANGKCIKILDSRSPGTTVAGTSTGGGSTLVSVLSRYMPKVLGGGAMQTAMPTSPTLGTNLQPATPTFTAPTVSPSQPATPLTPTAAQPSYQPARTPATTSSYTPPTTPLPLPRPPLGPTIEMPFDEEAPAAPAAPASSSKRNLLIVGGLGLAAYLYLRHRRRP